MRHALTFLGSYNRRTGLARESSGWEVSIDRIIHLGNHCVAIPSLIAFTSILHGPNLCAHPRRASCICIRIYIRILTFLDIYKGSNDAIRGPKYLRRQMWRIQRDYQVRVAIAIFHMKHHKNIQIGL
jgi:hypothetical protein